MSIDTGPAFLPSPQQRRAWHWAQRDGDALHRTRLVVHIVGDVDRCRLKRALHGVVQRHEILRTQPRPMTGLKTPVQTIVDAEEALSIDEQVAARDALPDGRWWTAGSAIVRAALMPSQTSGLDLLLSIGPGTCDRASCRTVVRELAEAYGNGADGPWPDEPFQYADFSQWQNDTLQDSDARLATAHWSSSADTPVVVVPGVHDRTESAAFALATTAARDLDAATTGRLEMLAQLLGVDPSDVFRATWRLLLARLTDQAQATIGVVHAGRKLDEFATAVGVYDRCVPEVCDAGATVAFAALARQSASARATAHRWQEYWDYGDDQYFPVWFECTEASDVVAVDGVTFQTTLESVCWDRFDLKLLCIRHGAHWSVECHANLNALPAVDLERIADRFVHALEDVLAHPSGRVGDTDVVPAVERTLLLEWGRGERSSAARDVYAAFEAQAVARPDAIAVESGDAATSYGCLHERASRLMSALRARAIGPEAVVGVYAARGIDFVVAMLSVFAARAAYLPLDPALPPQRIRYLLRDSGAQLVLTVSALRHALAADAVDVLCVDRTPEGERKTRSRAQEVSAGRLAYVIYTSGSTGLPKGVAVEQRQLANYVAAITSVLQPRAGSRFGWLSSPAADLGHTMLFPALTTGGRLVNVPEPAAIDAAAFGRYVAEHPVDYVKIVPSHLRALIDAGAGAAFADAIVITGGEAATWPLIESLRAHVPGCTIWNHYGPTETTVGCLARPVRERLDAAGCPTVPLGRPLRNADVAVLDRLGRPTPIGVAGELYIGGEGVTRAYLGRAALTADHFVPDHLSIRAGARLYRTGDRGRWRASGEIEFLGRVDHQVKIRGHRVELGEVEAVLREHTAVRECVAVVREAQNGDAQIAVFVTLDDAAALFVRDPARVHRLPNGLVVAGCNAAEADAQYAEIFEREAYMRLGARLPPNAIVIDVGANIGLFTLFVRQRCGAARVYAFEPAPALVDALRRNASACEGVTTFPFGLSDRECHERFLFYPRHTQFSRLARYADPQQDARVLRASLGDAFDDASADDVIDAVLKPEIEHVRLRRLSNVIREERIEHVDLLKIDVQGAELDVLRGLDADDWRKIDQIVLETHESDRASGGRSRVTEIVDLCRQHGYRVVSDANAAASAGGRSLLYASRLDATAGRSIDEAPAAVTRPAVPALVTAHALRAFAAARLPEAAVPAHIVILDKLPLTPNGKIDRERLVVPELPAAAAEHAPGQVEDLVANVWADVLGRDHVGPEDNFFDLGGHSLLATQVVSRLQEAFGPAVTVAAMFEAPTVASLARRIEASKRETEGVHVPPLQAVPRDGPLPLSFAQQRLWFLEQLYPDRGTYNSTCAIHLSGPLVVPALRSAIRQLVERHEVLRTCFPADNGEPVQQIVAELRLSVPLEDVSALMPRQRSAVIACRIDEEARKRFDLARAPLIRAVLLRLAAHEHVCVVSVHHIVTDGWSQGVMVRELTSSYAAVAAGRPAALPPLPIQYADYAMWQRGWLQGEALERQMEYWRRALRDVPTLTVPTDRPRRSGVAFGGGLHLFSIPADIADGLRQVARRHQATMFMVVLTAWQGLLARYNGHSDIVVGTPIANRTRPEVEGLIGCFINTLALRLAWRGDPPFTDLLARARECVLQAYVHQEVPFEQVVAAVQPERHLDETPLFRVMFSWHNEPRAPLQLAGLAWSLRSRGIHRSKFDLTLAVWEHAGALPAALEYRTDLFDRTTIERIAAHLQQLLAAVAIDPTRTLSQALLPPEQERGQLLEWSQMKDA